MISTVNDTNSAGNCGYEHIYFQILIGKLNFFVKISSKSNTKNSIDYDYK